MQPSKRNILDFIYKTDGYFKIPDFQRPYTWDNYQLDTFLEDLEQVVAQKHNHYFGTIVYVREHDQYVIIDGTETDDFPSFCCCGISHFKKRRFKKRNFYGRTH